VLGNAYDGIMPSISPISYLQEGRRKEGDKGIACCCTGIANMHHYAPLNNQRALTRTSHFQKGKWGFLEERIFHYYHYSGVPSIPAHSTPILPSIS